MDDREKYKAQEETAATIIDEVADKLAEARAENLAEVKPIDEVPIKREPKLKRQRLNFNTSNVSVEAAGEAYLEGKITAKAWSLMTPALRKAIERYAKKNKRNKKIKEVASENSVTEKESSKE